MEPVEPTTAAGLLRELVECVHAQGRAALEYDKALERKDATEEEIVSACNAANDELSELSLAIAAAKSFLASAPSAERVADVDMDTGCADDKLPWSAEDLRKALNSVRKNSLHTETPKPNCTCGHPFAEHGGPEDCTPCGLCLCMYYEAPEPPSALMPVERG